MKNEARLRERNRQEYLKSWQYWLDQVGSHDSYEEWYRRMYNQHHDIRDHSVVPHCKDPAQLAESMLLGILHCDYLDTETEDYKKIAKEIFQLLEKLEAKKKEHEGK
jgi:hypothetical protein